MRKSIKNIVLTASIVLFFCSTGFSGEVSLKDIQIPQKGIVTMVDLGAKRCVPCKMMAPILVKLEKAYKGKASIVFIDVWENKEPAKRFGVRAIPTQIFFDKNGVEVYRHTGFFDEKSIVEQLTKMGVSPPEEKSKV